MIEMLQILKFTYRLERINFNNGSKEAELKLAVIDTILDGMENLMEIDQLSVSWIVDPAPQGTSITSWQIMVVWLVLLAWF